MVRSYILVCLTYVYFHSLFAWYLSKYIVISNFYVKCVTKKLKVRLFAKNKIKIERQIICAQKIRQKPKSYFF